MTLKTLNRRKGKFAALVTKNLPTLSVEEMDFYTKNPKVLKEFLAEALVTQPKISKAISYMANQEVRDIEKFVTASA